MYGTRSNTDDRRRHAFVCPCRDHENKLVDAIRRANLKNRRRAAAPGRALIGAVVLRATFVRPNLLGARIADVGRQLSG